MSYPRHRQNCPTVYFVRSKEHGGPVKIGCSKDYLNRLRVADCWAPFGLEVIATIEGGFDLEHRFHALFADDHERLEWFAWSPRMAKVVELINEGRFDVSKLPPPQYVGHGEITRQAMARARAESLAA